jgi:nitrate/nitrite transporter NarK
MLADRFGGRRVYAALLVISALPAIAIGFSTSYTQLLILGLFLGLAGSTFPVGVVFYLFAHDAATTARPKTLSENLSVLRREPMAWVLSLFYFLTFGGFVALGIYLPTLLKDLFGLNATDAGARTAGFVLLATLTRPAGGWLADRVGGLGGFFPPLALGLIRDATGGYAWGFVFLACFALACLAVHYFTLVRPGGGAKPTKATVGGPQAALR